MYLLLQRVSFRVSMAELSAEQRKAAQEEIKTMGEEIRKLKEEKADPALVLLSSSNPDSLMRQFCGTLSLSL